MWTVGIMRTSNVLITDYAWEDLEEERTILARAGAQLLVAETSDEQELIRLAPDVDGILTCWKPVTAAMLDAATRCKSVGRYGIGLDNIDVGRATDLGIIVTNVPAYCLEEVSDHAMGLILACSRKIAFYDRAAKSGVYDLKAVTPLWRLAGKTLGIVGFGKIGKALARKAAAFGMRVVVYDPLLPSPPSGEPAVTLTFFEDLLAASDFISVHAPLTPQTRRLFSAEALALMKCTAFLINTADNEHSAITRLSRMLQERSQRIDKNLTLDNDGSALFRLKRELAATIQSMVDTNAAFQSEVRATLAALRATKEEAARSTTHGRAFEDQVGPVLATEAQRLSDIYEVVGTKTGEIQNCKIGDFVTTLGPDSAAPGARVVWEAKEHRSYDLKRALAEAEKLEKTGKPRSVCSSSRPELLRKGCNRLRVTVMTSSSSGTRITPTVI